MKRRKYNKYKSHKSYCGVHSYHPDSGPGCRYFWIPSGSPKEPLVKLSAVAGGGGGHQARRTYYRGKNTNTIYARWLSGGYMMKLYFTSEGQTTNSFLAYELNKQAQLAAAETAAE